LKCYPSFLGPPQLLPPDLLVRCIQMPLWVLLLCSWCWSHLGEHCTLTVGHGQQDHVLFILVVDLKSLYWKKEWLTIDWSG
jgi:hypothetical protein